jgi:hypothetical protein
MFQSESKKSGDKFEDLVQTDLKRMGHKRIRKHVILTDIGVEADFAHRDYDGTQVYVEAKGGEQGAKKRPGAKRTDSVKKAIANGALIKSAFPDVRFVVYFSDLPKKNSSSDKMIKEAIKANYIDTVRYLIEV